MRKWLGIKILLALFIIISCIVIPISYARYIANYNGTSNIDVAKWDITINNKKINEEFTFNLFETIDNTNLKKGVKAITPGASGNITLNIKNSSDVVAEYTITIEETSNENNIPILYSLEEFGEYKKINEFIIANNQEIGIDTNNTKTITIYWKWSFYQDSSQNQKDNELGQNGNALLQVKMNIKANQKIN